MLPKRQGGHPGEALIILELPRLVSFKSLSRWRRGWQPCCELRENVCSFSYVLFVFLLFYVLDVVSITVYDRDTLLNIGSSVAQRKPDFEFFNAGGLFTDTASEPFVWVAKSRRRRRHRKRGKIAGVLVRTETPCFPTSSSNHFTGQRSVTG